MHALAWVRPLPHLHEQVEAVMSNTLMSMALSISTSDALAVCHHQQSAHAAACHHQQARCSWFVGWAMTLMTRATMYGPSGGVLMRG